MGVGNPNDQPPYGISCLRIRASISPMASTPFPIWMIRSKACIPPNLSFTLLSKVLQKLKNEGFITSVQGMRGGYSLKRSLDSIFIKEILNLFESNDSLTHCTSSQSKSCPHVKTCPARGPLTRLDSRIQSIFNSLTLEDLLKERQ